MKARKFAFPGWSSLLIAMVYLLICNQSAAETMPQSEKAQYAPSSSYKKIAVTLPAEQHEKFNQLVIKKRCSYLQRARHTGTINFYQNAFLKIEPHIQILK